MRNKEPLQGLSMLQGHFVMHFAMFCASFAPNMETKMPDFIALYPHYSKDQIIKVQNRWIEHM